MAFFDLPLHELQQYKPQREEPADFDQFWQKTLSEARLVDWQPQFVSIDQPLVFVDVFDVTFPGFEGQKIRGWLLIPKNTRQPLPCVVEYIGYGGGRGKPMEWLNWVNAGYAHFIMDTRGQGASWRTGDTPDNFTDDERGQFPGFMTRGIQNPQSYYYRRLITDAVRAVDAAQSHPMVDETRIIITGGSQGGGLTLAAAGLRQDVSAALPEVPFLCHYRRATQLTNSDPYYEITNYLKNYRDQVETVFHTLSYFDGVNFAARATAKALFSVGLMDPICPPSTVYAAFNHYAGTKEIAIYSYNEHEGGGIDHFYKKMEFLKQIGL
ncbi:MAG: acetylxylan esterase [Anaerolineaceae bacterium]|nr:acetylxylan esterase [Anaerolineaceae bacterium]